MKIKYLKDFENVYNKSPLKHMDLSKFTAENIKQAFYGFYLEGYTDAQKDLINIFNPNGK